MELTGKIVIAMGERDGIPGPAIELVARSAGADQVYSFNQCFV
jgi:glycine reductase